MIGLVNGFSQALKKSRSPMVRDGRISRKTGL